MIVHCIFTATSYRELQLKQEKDVIRRGGIWDSCMILTFMNSACEQLQSVSKLFSRFY
jgi:hypothetical protein